jgi:hypothetical protein
MHSILKVTQLKSLEDVSGPFKNIAELVSHATQIKGLEKAIGPFNGSAELVERVTQLKASM